MTDTDAPTKPGASTDTTESLLLEGMALIAADLKALRTDFAAFRKSTLAASDLTPRQLLERVARLSGYDAAWVEHHLTITGMKGGAE